MKQVLTNEPGIFVPVPDAFTDADKDLRNVCKFEFKTAYSRKHRVVSIFSTNRLLVDLGELDKKKLNVKKMIKDCDYLKSILLKYPGEVQAMMESLNEKTSKGISKADKLMQKTGLTEKASAKAGGGLFWLVIPLVVAGLASGCTAANSNKPYKASTTPKPPSPPPDGGSPQ